MLRKYVIAVFLGLLFSLGFAPNDLWFVSLLSLTCLHFLIQEASKKELFYIGYFYGFGLWSLGISWVYVSIYFYGNIGFITSIILTIIFITILSLYLGVTLLLYHYLRFNSKFSIIFSLPLAWIVVEYLRSILFTGFPWLISGTMLADTLIDGGTPIIGAQGNFHGRTLAAVSMSDDPDSRDDFGPFVPGIELVPYNDIEALESIFKEKGDRIAAYSVEPIQGEAGVIVPDDDYWPKVEKLCKEHNILLAMDEVQTGFGRTGANFAHQLFNVKPDIIGCGKAAGGGILPVSFVAGKKEIIDTLTPGSEGSTFGGYPLAAVVGVYAIKTLVDLNLAENARIRGEQLMNHFNDIKDEFPDKIKENRGRGLLTAFEMFNEKHLDGHKVSVELLNHGVYAKETHHSTVRIAPALTIEAWQIDNMAEKLRKVIKSL